MKSEYACVVLSKNNHGSRRLGWTTCHSVESPFFSEVEFSLITIKLELPEAPKSHDASKGTRISPLRWIAGDQLAWLSVVYLDMLRIVQTDSSILLRTRERLHSLTYSVVAFSSPYSVFLTRDPSSLHSADWTMHH